MKTKLTDARPGFQPASTNLAATRLCPHPGRRGWWLVSSGVATANGTNSISITSPAGNLFFRLGKP